MPIGGKKPDPHPLKRIGQHQEFVNFTFAVPGILYQHDDRKHQHSQEVENVDTAQNIKKTTTRQTPEIHAHQRQFPPPKKL